MAEPIYLNFISLFGLFGFCAIAYLFSEDRRLSLIPWSLISWGIGFQLLFGFLIFRFAPTRSILASFIPLIIRFYGAAHHGAIYIFSSNFIPLQFLDAEANFDYIFAWQILPFIILISGITAFVYKLGILRPLIGGMTRLFYPNLALSGAEATSGIANIFFGIEAIILIRPFLLKMTRSELCAILACGFGTAGSSVLMLYTTLVNPLLVNNLGDFVAASILAVPACFTLAKIIVPEPVQNRTLQEMSFEDQKPSKENPFTAAFVGAFAGVKVVAGIIAGLILVLGIVALLGQIFTDVGNWRFVDNPLLKATGYFFTVVNLQNILGFCFYPLVLLTGISFHDSWLSAIILGRRFLETTIPAYQALVTAGVGGEISDRTIFIMTYALTGFAHVAGIGILTGGVSILVPSRRWEIVGLSGKALLAGTLATLMVACIAGVYQV